MLESVHILTHTFVKLSTLPQSRAALMIHIFSKEFVRISPSTQTLGSWQEMMCASVHTFPQCQADRLAAGYAMTEKHSSGSFLALQTGSFE